MCLLSLVGIKVVLVHGGGPEITPNAAKGWARNPSLSAACASPTRRPPKSCRWCCAARSIRIWSPSSQQNNGRALGLCGIDGHMLRVQKLAGEVDLGYVGDITSVDTTPILNALHNGYIPVIATVGTDETGQVYNINADTAAARIASELAQKTSFS